MNKRFTTNRATYIVTLIQEAKKGGTKSVLTVSQLRSYADQLGKNKEPRPVSIISTNPIIQNKTLTIKGEARGTKIYPITVTFYNVDYSLEKDGAHPLYVRPKVGDPFYMQPVSSGQNPVQVRCSCPFFRHAYAHWDKQEKALTGPAFPTYVRKTQTRPEVNPGHLPGVCKHIIGFFDRLTRDKVLV